MDRVCKCDGPHGAMCPVLAPGIDADAAAAAVRAGARVRMAVGEAPDDPVLMVWAEDGMVMSESIGGWSAGVVEPVCSIESDFLTNDYLRGTLEVAPEGVTRWRATW